MSEFKVGVRYCGGCNPRYDRVKVVKRLQKLLPYMVFSNAEDGASYDAVLVVSGCSTQCTKIDDLSIPAGRLIRVNGFEDIIPVRDQLKGLNDTSQVLTLSREQVMDILPHRKPMLFIDDVPRLTPGQEITARYRPGTSLPVFAGHFPSEAVFPGVLIIEAMAQAADIMLLTLERYKGKVPYFMGIEKADFRRRVLPDEEMLIHVSLKDERSEIGACICKCRVTVNNRTVSDAEIILALR